MYLLYTFNHITHKKTNKDQVGTQKSAHVQKQHVVVCSSGSGVLPPRGTVPTGKLSQLAYRFSRRITILLLLSRNRSSALGGATVECRSRTSVVSEMEKKETGGLAF